MIASTVQLEPIETNNTIHRRLLFSEELLNLTVRQVLASRSVAFLGVSLSCDDPSKTVHGYGVGAVSIDVAPVGQCFRVDVNTLDDAPLCPELLLRSLQSFAKACPGGANLAGVIEFPKQGFVILLPAIGQND